MSKVRDIVAGGFDICGDVHVYDCRDENLSWHEAEKFDEITDAVLDMDVAYMCVDGYALQIEAR